MPIAIIKILETFGIPVIIFLIGIGSGYQIKDYFCVAEANEKQVDLDKRYIALQEETTKLKETIASHNKSVEQTINSYNQKIEEEHAKNESLSEKITASNRDLVDLRLRQSKLKKSTYCNSDRLSDTTKSTSSGTLPEFDGTWMVSKSIANRLVDRHELAGTYLESLRACRSYVEIIQKTINNPDKTFIPDKGDVKR
jgi:DNA repair exonuclease SbcCD ATPase subunit